MAILYNTDERNVIPKWRNFQSAVVSGELEPVGDDKASKMLFNSSVLAEQKSAWSTSKNLSTAGDLLSSAFVLGHELDFKPVAKYIIENSPKQNSPLYKLSEKTLGIVNTLNSELEQNSDVEAVFDKEKYYSNIRLVRFNLKSEPNNAIAWMELGRLYTLINLLDKAQVCVERALQLDKNNRFIVRSASRFYHHLSKDSDKSLSIIRRSKYGASDPWLISADIAYSTMLKRYSKLTKSAIEYLSYKSIDPFTTSELASAIGTAAHANKQVNQSRKYFNQSLIKPNENSLAQYLWMSKRINMTKPDLSKYNIPLAFEVQTHDNYNNRNYRDAYLSALKWLGDEPYSTRPVKLASYIASTFLDDKKTAIELNKKGLEINSEDQLLQNNLIYDLAMDDQIEEATRLFDDLVPANFQNLNQDTNITLRATAGLLLFRQGEIENGRRLYKEALDIANKENRYLYALGLANYAREEIRAQSDRNLIDDLMLKVNEVCEKSNEPDVQHFYKKVVLDYDNYMKKV